MFLLDTNVISELRRLEAGKGDLHVRAWLASVEADSLYLSVISVFEMEAGHLSMLRKDPIQAGPLGIWLRERVLPEFGRRLLNVDRDTALVCAALHVPDPKPYRDSLIGATALVHGMTVVTRNAKDFEPMGCKVLNPWEG
jgi:predicted nucleic acid-binding protein